MITDDQLINLLQEADRRICLLDDIGTVGIFIDHFLELRYHTSYFFEIEVEWCFDMGDHKYIIKIKKDYFVFEIVSYQVK